MRGINLGLTGGDTAAKEAHLVEVGTGVNFSGRDFGDDRVLGEGGAAHEVVDGLPVLGQSAGAIGHQTLALKLDFWFPTQVNPFLNDSRTLST